MERLIYECGNDPDFYYYQTPSWSGTIDPNTGEVEVYELTVDKRNGEIRCSCMGCVCHFMTGMLTDLKAGNTCKHIRRLVENHLVFVLSEEQ